MSPTRSSAAGALVALLTAMALLLSAPAASSAAGDEQCAGVDEVSNAAGECVSNAEPVPTLDPEWSASFKPPKQARAQSVLLCRRVDAVFYAASDWVRLGQKLAANASPCAQYYISIPPNANDKKITRPQQPPLIHKLGPNFHVMFEFNLNGWRPWVDGGNGTWYDAGVEWRRRMAASNFQDGDVWVLNELGDATRTHTGPQRENMENAVRGLYEGDGGPPIRGAVWTSGMGQSTTNLLPYKGNLEEWMKDPVFWATMSQYARFFPQEVYGDIRRWAVPGGDLTARRDTLADYLEHVQILSGVGPAEIAATRDYLQTADAPTGNCAWAFQSGFGWTYAPYTVMKAFVASQVYAFRWRQAGDTWREGDSFGCAWSPTNDPPPFGLTKQEYADQTAAILDQLAASIHASDAPTDPPGIGACGPDGSWCAADWDGATFNLNWHWFWTWTQPAASDGDVTLDEDTTADIALKAYDPDEGETLTYEVVKQPAHGTVSGDGASRTYTPATDFNGSDSFTFQASDGVMTSAVATVHITVTPVNDAPTVALTPPDAMDEGGPAQTLTAHAADVDGDVLVYGWNATHATILSFGQTAELTVDDGPAVVHATVTVEDGQGGTATDWADVAVRNVAPAAEAGADLTAMWRIPAALTGSGSDQSATDTAALAASWDFGDRDPAVHGFGVAHAWNEVGSYIATLTVTDKDGAAATDTASVSIARRPARLVYAGPQTAVAPWATLYARISDLADRHTERLGGHRLTIALGSRSCTASSNSGGLAMCAINVTGLPLGQTPVTVTFPGDELYAPAGGASTIQLQ